MNITRKAYAYLLEWKASENRKPLLLRGARQVGKTTLIRDLAREFSNYIELNLEREADKNLFITDDVSKILNAAYLLKGVVPSKKPTLLFIDEIQESPKAIQLLRYFFEEKPDLYVIAAGSLLEFAMQQVPSFPVGRIDHLYLHPLNFEEYLGGLNHTNAMDILKTIPVPDYAHQIMLDLYHEYAIIGGMPEIVGQYIDSKNIAMLSKTYSSLWQTYTDDVEKYARNTTEKNVMRHVIQTAPYELDRIKFEGFGNSNYRSREVGEALRSLSLARIIQLVYPTTNLIPPITPNLRKRPRFQFLDTGLLNSILGLQGEMITIQDLNDFHRGKIIHHLICQEIISTYDELRYIPHFWVREEKDANSEVDIVLRHSEYLIPVEVKSGKQGRLRSLHQFIDRTNHPYAIRMYAGSFSIEKHTTPSGKLYYLMNLPYYLGGRITDYINYLIKSTK
ncbi:MAG: ATP-binding protein [Bacteroidetes bacterium]|nr:ATP-binding protein [Bacteroidota bacterium]